MAKALYANSIVLLCITRFYVAGCATWIESPAAFTENSIYPSLFQIVIEYASVAEKLPFTVVSKVIIKQNLITVLFVTIRRS